MKDSIKELSPFQQIINKFLRSSYLQTLCEPLKDLVSKEIAGKSCINAKPFVHRRPLPSVTDHPLSTFVSLNPDSQAVQKVLLAPIGFFWQTIESEELSIDEESLDDDDNGADNGIQNTMSIITRDVFAEPRVMFEIFMRIFWEGLYICGLRIVYPTQDLMRTSGGAQSTAVIDSGSVAVQNEVGPLLAIALRGASASKAWMHVVGPADPALARRTDPTSLCALFGGESREHCPIFCPRTPNRTTADLVRWFGGRVPPNGVIELGEQATQKSATSRGKKGKPIDVGSEKLSAPVYGPVAMLNATSRSDIFLTVSPLIPTRCLGVIITASQRRGYQLRGIKRLVLDPKKASCLGEYFRLCSEVTVLVIVVIVLNCTTIRIFQCGENSC